MGKKKPETELVRISNQYGLTAPQRKGLETILAAEPNTTQEVLAEQIGVRRETVNVWLHQRSFLDALHEAASLIIQQDWPEILKVGLKAAKAGDIQWAKWISEIAGYYQSQSTVKHTGKVEQKHTGEIGLGGLEAKELAETVGLIRQLQTPRGRKALTN